MRQLLLVGLLVVAALHGVFLAYALMPDGDAEGVYLYHGSLALTGQIGLYQDDMTGHRMPLPYYIAGLSQIVFGPSLIAARLVSVAFGLGAVVLLWSMTARIAGPMAGDLALILGVGQAYLMGHFARAAYEGLISFLVATGLWMVFASKSRYAHFWTCVILLMMFFTRPQIWPIIPVAVLWLAWRAPAKHRWWCAAMLVVPVAVFFAWPSHAKLFAYIPMVHGLVPNFAAPDISYRQAHGFSAWWDTAFLLAKSYKGWFMLAAVLTVVGAWRGLNRKVVLVTVIAMYLSVWQVVIVNMSPKMAAGYFPMFAILWAVPLAVGLATAIEQCVGWSRSAVVAIAGACVLMSPIISPHPALPLTVSLAEPAGLAPSRAASALRSVVPAGSSVFLFGGAEAPYLAGLRPHLQQANHLETLSPIQNRRLRSRSGLWGEDEIKAWLGPNGDDWAIIRTNALDRARQNQRIPSGNNVDLIYAMLAERFSIVADLPGRLTLYHRRPAVVAVGLEEL